MKWVHIYLAPNDVTYFRAKLTANNIQRLRTLGYRIEVEEELKAVKHEQRTPGFVGAT